MQRNVTHTHTQRIDEQISAQGFKETTFSFAKKQSLQIVVLTSFATVGHLEPYIETFAIYSRHPALKLKKNFKSGS